MRKQHTTRLTRWAALIGAVALGACVLNVDNPFGQTGSTTQLSLTLTSRAPAPSEPPSQGTSEAGAIRAGVVTISGIYLQGGEADQSDNADDAGRVWLSRSTRTTDLLRLSDNFSDLVSGATVQQGSYDQLRMIITGGYIEVAQDDGSTRIYASSPDYEGLPAGAAVDGQLRMPSESTSGLKVDLPNGAFDIQGDQMIVLLEFDVSQSFGHAAGSSNAWVMHPVVTATDVKFTSSVEVEASLAPNATLPQIDGHQLTMEDLEADLSDASQHARTLMLANVDDDPAFEAVFPYVNPLNGPYTISLNAGPDLVVTTDPETPFSVDVPSGQVIVYPFTITSVRSPTAASVEVEADLAEGVTLPEIDGQPVSLADFRAVVTDALRGAAGRGTGHDRRHHRSERHLPAVIAAL